MLYSDNGQIKSVIEHARYSDGEHNYLSHKNIKS